MEVFLMPVTYSSQIPPYMQKGSHGPHVTLLQAFLFGALGARIQTLLVFDSDYGQMTCARVKDLQEDLGFQGIDIDGNFGQATRAKVKEKYGFDFEAACLTIPGITTFIQPHGKDPINWSPEKDRPTRHVL